MVGWCSGLVGAVLKFLIVCGKLRLPSPGVRATCAIWCFCLLQFGVVFALAWFSGVVDVVAGCWLLIFLCFFCITNLKALDGPHPTFIGFVQFLHLARQA